MREWAARNGSWETGRRVSRTPSAHPLLALQRTAGNRAVNALIARRRAQGGQDLELEAEEDALGARAARGEPAAVPVGPPMGAALGADFSPVRVHAGESAAPGLDAAAFARGQDVHFAPGGYVQEEEELYGHELAHAVQVRRGGV